MKTENNEELYCHYSDLPSPMAYVHTCTDYDSMGNHGRFPAKKEETTAMKRIFQKFLFFVRASKPKQKEKIK